MIPFVTGNERRRELAIRNDGPTPSYTLSATATRLKGRKKDHSRAGDTIRCEDLVDDVKFFGNDTPSLNNDSLTTSAPKSDGECGEG